MMITQPLPFVIALVDAVDEAMKEHHPGQGLSALQRSWLAFCLTAIFVTKTVCWARFERASLGTYSLAAFSWMFRHAKILWELLLVSSVRMVLRPYGSTHGSLVWTIPINNGPTQPRRLPTVTHCGTKKAVAASWANVSSFSWSLLPL
jgi:hypothetical protein